MRSPRSARVKGLRRIVGVLEAMYGRPHPPPASGPFEMALLENVAYLADDARRAEAFEILKARAGTSPAGILSAPRGALLEATRRGGIHPEERAERLRECARIAVEDLGGDVEAALSLPLPAAKRALRKFPGIGEPGAEKILLFAGRRPILALESNGLRVLLRLGYGEEDRSYSRSYRSAQAAAESEIDRSAGWLMRAHLLLRAHGKETCKAAAPRCEACPLAAGCRYYLSNR